jgi:hypothetical protein
MDEFITRLKGTWAYDLPKRLRDGSLLVGAALRLERESNNQYDQNAIAVYFNLSKIGHISAPLAARIAPYLDAGGEVDAQVTAISVQRDKRGDYPTLSIRLRLHTFTAPIGLEQILQQAKYYNHSSGIYSIRSLDTNQEYIGSALDVGSRLRQHFQDLHSGLHSNHGLSIAWHRHGPSGFSIEIIEHVEPQRLAIREGFYIKQRGSYSNGYNRTADGQGSNRPRITGATQTSAAHVERIDTITPEAQPNRSGCAFIVIATFATGISLLASIFFLASSLINDCPELKIEGRL